MDINISNEKLSQINIDMLFVPVLEKQIKVEPEDIFDIAQNAYGFEAKYLETLNITTLGKISAKNIVFVGIGKENEFTFNRLRVAFSKAFQKIKNLAPAKTIAVAIDGIFEDKMLAAQTISEAALIGLYKFDKYKTDKQDDKQIEALTLITDFHQDVMSGIQKAKTICNAVNFARDLVNEPAEFITPQKLADIAQNINGLETKVYDFDEIRDMGMGAFLAVAQGSRHQPRFIHMKYSPDEKQKTIAIVGKGITFDSGGLDIKPASSMLEMKGDMAGAAATIAIMRAITELKPNVEVHGIIAACENMLASCSYKPGDVLTAMNGKTIEVDNTDAEGRLTLADALCYAEKLNVDAIIDIATLTGACCVALGKVASGLMGNNDDLIETLQISADEVGEYLWEMPMFNEFFEDLKSDIADFKNSGTRYGGTSAAALFLKKFINDTPWAHIDIAGTSILNKPIRELPKGVSGVGVRTIINFIEHL